MSGPITPPLEVTEVDGNPSGRPITKIIVSNGDLSISGRTATIDTTGSGGIPATPADAIQFNSDPAGTFTADAGFVMSVIGGGASTVTQTGNILTGGNKIATATSDGTVNIISDGTGQIVLSSGNDQGGTWTDSIVNIMANANTDDAQLKFRDSANTDNGSITLDGNGDMILNNNVANKEIHLKMLGTGQVLVENQTTDTDTTLGVKGNGTGIAYLTLSNPTKAIQLACDENQKLKVKGGVNSFIFDASSATGGITWPDGTTQITASSGASFPLEAPDGTVSAPSYSFSSETNTGLYRYGAGELGVAVGGSLPITISGSSVWFQTGKRLRIDAGSAMTPGLSFYNDGDTGIYSVGTNSIGISTGGTEQLRISANGAFGFGGPNYGTSSQVLTSAGNGAVPTWEDAASGGSFNAEITSGDDIDSTYSLNRVDATPPYGMNTGNNGQTSRDEPMFFPFIASESSTVDGIVINITAGAGSACNAVVAIYSDNNGVPQTKLGSDATFDATATGQVEQTSVGTITLVRGTQYWIGWTRSASVSFTWMCGSTTTPWFGPTENLSSSWNVLWIPSPGSDNTLPASITATDLAPRGYARISVGVNQ